MSDLLDRLTILDREALIASLHRVEAMACELEPNTLYPESEIVNRVLGLSIRLEEPRQLVGAAILTDLSVIAERVSDQVRLRTEELSPGAFSLDEILDRWGVSKKSIDRYRRCGLIAQRVRDERGRTKLIFTKSAVESFEQSHADRLARASRFRRVSGSEDEQIQSLAERYHRRLRWSLNQSAKRIAERRGLSHEGVRQILRRAQGRGEIRFGEQGPPTDRERLITVRAARRGSVGSPESLAARWGRSKPSIRRALNEGRADILRALELGGPILESFSHESAGEVILGAPPVVGGLGGAGLESVEELLTWARRRTPPVEAEETARAAAVHFLRWQAGTHVAGLNNTTASGTALDRIETDLRWASLLKIELLRPHLGQVLEALESRAGMRLEELGGVAMRRWWVCGLGAASLAVDGFDPSGKGRLAGRIGLGVDRAASDLSRREKPQVSKAKRAVSVGARWRDWTLSVDPWQRWLGIDSRVRSVLWDLPERSHRVLALRLGLPGGGEGSESPAEPPRTLEETAQRIGTARVHAARFEREAITEALALFRQTTGSDVP